MSHNQEFITFDTEVDASGLACPLPILRTKKALATLESGQVVKVITTDTHAKDDFQAFAEQTGNTLLAQHLHPSNNDALVHYLQRR